MMISKHVSHLVFLAAMLFAFAPRTGVADEAAVVDDAQLVAAFNAVGAAQTYEEVQTALAEHGAVLGSARALELTEQALRTPGITAEQRVLVLMVRQSAVEVAQYGTPLAGQILAARLIAAAAMRANSPTELAEFLDTRFAALAGGFESGVVGAALQAPTDLWPAGLLPLMEQFVADWASAGALAAATRMAAAAHPGQGAAETAPTYFEDDVAGAFIGAGRPIPDGLIVNPQY